MIEELPQSGVGTSTEPVIKVLARLRVPLGRQEIELQQIDYPGASMSLLRVRIREGSRFTVFDIDAGTAAGWAEAMGDWAHRQPGGDR